MYIEETQNFFGALYRLCFIRNKYELINCISMGIFLIQRLKNTLWNAYIEVSIYIYSDRLSDPLFLYRYLDKRSFKNYVYSNGGLEWTISVTKISQVKQSTLKEGGGHKRLKIVYVVCECPLLNTFMPKIVKSF